MTAMGIKGLGLEGSRSKRNPVFPSFSHFLVLHGECSFPLKNPPGTSRGTS